MPVLNRDAKRMILEAKDKWGMEAMELVGRAYVAGIRDASNNMLAQAQDIARELEKEGL